MGSCAIRDKILDNKFFKETNTHEFLARARLSFFKGDYRLSFIYTWIAIEAILRNIWEGKMIEKYGSRTAASDLLKDNRSWTISNVTEVLFQLGYLSLDDTKQIRKIRRKRNDLFHSSSIEKREVSRFDAFDCINTGLFLLYREAGLTESTNIEGLSIIDASNIRNNIFNAIHSHNPE